MTPSGESTEVEAYKFILDQLKEVGWNTKNPSQYPDGQVWTQNQCLRHPEIKKTLGSTRPENIVKLSEKKLWVIEAKSTRAQLAKALKEAEDDYAKVLMDGGYFSVPLISGVAGNYTTGFEVRTYLLVGTKYKPIIINGKEATGFLDEKTITNLLASGRPVIADFVVNEIIFLRAAERINRILHLGGINKNDRAKVMAALLLVSSEAPGPNVESTDLLVLIGDINTRTKAVLRRNEKVEFHPFIKIEPPTNSENHLKFMTAIIQTIQELKNLSIKSAMNSGTDVLGKFYEVFLKYGNGAKEIGIVLTPRHITRFAVEALGVEPNDIVLDPACGTGGFLVAAFDHVRQQTTPTQIDVFKQHNLFGIERESYVAALAIVNMIFRGDGRNNIVEANCFTKYLKKSTVDGQSSAVYVCTPPPANQEAVTRVLMNPPFALKESDEKEHRFVENALLNMRDGGLLFAIVPISVMVEGGVEEKWRRDTLLTHNTLLSVISFPEELFYPIANQTVGIIVRKGVPHPRTQSVLWCRIVNDGFKKSKGKRLPIPNGPQNDLERVLPTLRGFLDDPNRRIRGVPQFIKKIAIDYTDPHLELVPEAYLDSPMITSEILNSNIDELVRENVAFLIRNRLEDSVND